MLLLFLQEFQKSEATDVIEIKLFLPAVLLSELSIKGTERSYLDLYYLGGDSHFWIVYTIGSNVRRALF